MMERTFLHPTGLDDMALTRFIAQVGTATGFMKGAPGGVLPGWHRMGADNSLFLRTLHGQLAATYPQAGPAFHAVRMWTGLTWQPAYLAVIAVHLHGALPAVTRLSQARSGIYVSGYRLEPGPEFSGSVEAMIERAGAALRAHADAVLAEVNAEVKLRPVPALRLLAERMLGLMVRLRHFRPDVSLDEQLRFCGLWLEATGLTGHGALEVIELPDGRQAAIVHRKGCCLDYLVTPDRLCASCPKQEPAVRIERQRVNVMAELER